MQFNSEATNQDCVSEILKICEATTAQYPLVDITRRFNLALDRYFELAFKADGNATFDDINQTGAPTAAVNLVSGTSYYKLGDFSPKILDLFQLEILGSANERIKLTHDTVYLDDNSFNYNYNSSVTGTPTHYTIKGDFIYLKPTPNYNKTNGLIAHFDRPASYIASTDTTKVPGVPVIHHGYLCRQASVPYLIEKRLPHLNNILGQIFRDEREIMSYFSHRNQDDRKRLIPNQQDTR